MKTIGLCFLVLSCALSVRAINTTMISVAPQAGYLSLPAAPIITDPAMIFSGFSNLQRWDPFRQSFIAYDALMPEIFGGVLPWEGYQLTGPIGQTLDYESPYCDGIQANVWISLPSNPDNLYNPGGRFLIGTPFNEPVPTANIHFTNGLLLKSWAEAADAGWVEPPNNDDNLLPGQCVWLTTHLNGLAVVAIAPEPRVRYSIGVDVTLRNWIARANTILPIQVKYRFTGTNDVPSTLTIKVPVISQNGAGLTHLNLAGLPPGNYDLWLKCRHWLAAKIIGINLTAGSQSASYGLFNGDINGDNKVDFSDYLILQAQYKKSGINLSADLNGDGHVDFADYLILQISYKKTGATL